MKKSFGNNTSLFEEDQASPMDGVQNMSDCMLVLAVGIMLALVINWKIDIGSYKNNVEVDMSNAQELNDDTAKSTNDVSVEELESNYVKTGSVYQDLNTGKTYVVIEE